jgi:lipopolysaccharide biosynthesis regulator YciM
MDSFLATVVGIALAAGAAILFANWYRQREDTKAPSRRFYVEGLKAALSGDEDRAYAMLRKAALADTGNADAYLRIGDIFRSRGQHAKAVQIHRELTMRPGVDAEVRRAARQALVLDHLAADQPERAAEVLGSMDEKESGEWVFAHKVEVFERLGRWSEAAAALERLSDRTGAEDAARLALIRVEEGRALLPTDGHKARLALRKAIKVDETCVPAYLHLGDSYVADDRHDDALSAWGDLAVVAPTSAYLMFPRYEDVLFELGRYGEAESFYGDLLARDPENVYALAALAQLHEKKAQYDRAAECYEDILRIDPDVQVARLRLARTRSLSGDSEGALSAYDESVEKLSLLPQVFVCFACGAEGDEPAWRCPECGTWEPYEL